MANMHVLGSAPGGYTIICHFAIPATSNDAGLAHRTAYVRRVGTLTTVLPDGDGTLGTISSAEKTSLTQTTPTLAEVPKIFQIPSDWDALSGANKNARLDAWFTVAQTEWQNSQADVLRYWGYTR